MASSTEANSISLCMIVKNEQQFLARCLESVRGLVEEIIVCDTGSQDCSKQIAQSFGAKVYDLPWQDSFEQARNSSLEYATGDWILVLDADEAVAANQDEKLRELLQQQKCYSLLRRHYFSEPQGNLKALNAAEYAWPEKPLGYITTHDIRLFPNDLSIRYRGEIHESVEHSIVAANKFAIERSDLIIHHFGNLKEQASRKAKSENYIQLCLRKIKSGTNDWRAWFELGVELQQLGRQAEGMDCLKQALALCPDYHPSWLQLGLGMMEAGDLDDAVECFGKALNISSNCMMTWNAMGVAFMRLKRIDEAILCFQTILDAEPDNLSVQNNMQQARKLKEAAPLS